MASIAFVALTTGAKDVDVSAWKGKSVPNLILSTQDAQKFELSQFRGGVVLVNFWATWCPPCIEELPSMEALSQHMKAKPFSMIAVSVDESWSDIEAFKARLSRRPSFTILLDPAGKDVKAQLGIHKFPETFLVSPEGVVLEHFQGPVDWMSPRILSQIESALSPTNRK